MRRAIKISALVIVGVLGLATLPLIYAIAGAVFNNHPKDYPTLQASNYTNCPGCTNWSRTISADAGEIVSFLVYYHNNGNETAKDTRIRLNLPASRAQTQNVSADLWASNAASVRGEVTVNISSAQSFVLIPKSVTWYPNRSSTPHTLLYGQNTLLYGQTGREIVQNNGLRLGDIGPCWETQGYVVVRARVTEVFPPTATTKDASNIGVNSARLNGSVNPKNLSTTVWFEWGTSSTELTNRTPNKTVTGNQNVDVFANLTGLSQNKKYYFRVVAENKGGRVQGSVKNFTTLTVPSPTVTTQNADNITQNSGRLKGSVNPNGYQTTVWFEWGTSSTELTNTTPEKTIAADTSLHNVSYTLSGLSSETRYYFRIAARNSGGTSRGAVNNFQTESGFPGPIPPNGPGPLPGT